MVKHILADGTELRSIEGRIIPPDGATLAVYKLISEFLVNSNNKSVKEKKRMQENKA